MLLVRSPNESIAVIITCHQYEQFLGEAIDSVLSQSLLPTEIIVVDDKPTAATTHTLARSDFITDCQQVLQHYEQHNIKYLRTEFGDPLKAREAGFKASSSKYLCFLDADDQLGDGYLQKGNDILTTADASIVYSDIEYFGEEEREAYFPRQLPPSRADICNFMHVGCLVTREAILASDAFNHPTMSGEYQEDWMFWRKITHAGHRVIKQDAQYRIRTHDTNRSKHLINTIGYYGMRGIEAATITFAANYPIENLFWTEQNWPKSQIQLSLYSTIPHTMLRTSCDFSISSNPDRINHAARTADTDYIFYYNETLDYPPDICEILLRHFDTTIAGVHNSEYEPFDCTMVVASIMRENVSNGQLLFRKGEKIVQI